MSVPIIQADYEQLDRVVRCFEAQADLNQQLYQRLCRGVAALQDGDWVGAAANTFYTEMNAEVLPAMKRLIEAMEQATVVTCEISAIIQTAEAEAAAPFKNGSGEGLVVGERMPDNKISSSPPPPRIYIINGINSQGNVPGAFDLNGNMIRGDDDSVAVERLLEKYGYDPDQVTSTSAIFIAPKGTNLTGTALTGTHFGGLLSPIDWLMGAAASTVNTVTDAGADFINQASGAAVGSIYGSVEVLAEYISGEHGKYTERIYNEIAADLRDNPLAPGQTVMLMGHSGGGAVTANLAGMLERNLGVDVSGMVTMGSPVSNYDEAGHYVELIADVSHAQDRIGAPTGTGVIRSEESRVGVPAALLSSPSLIIPTFVSVEAMGRNVGANPNVATVVLDRPVGGVLEAHGSYMHDPNVSVDMLHQLNRLFPNMNLRLPEPSL